MSTEPLVSIVVPTVGRHASLMRLLAALSWQSSPPPFEVIVVIDGVGGTGLDAVRLRDAFPFHIRLLALDRPSGAGAARNAGAAIAGAPVLLFMDDDVEPGPGCVSAHSRAHVHAAELLGAGGLEPRPEVGGYLGSALAGWWEAMNDRLLDPRHRFTFRDVLAGHCSIRRDTFEALGGFDETLRCHEDFDLGYRAIRAGVEVRFVPGADGVHHDGSDLTRILRRKHAEGRASVQLARKHRELLTALPMGRPLAPGRAARAMFTLAMRASRPADRVVTAAAEAALWTLERASMRDKWRLVLDRAMDYWYWRGVREEAMSEVAVRSYRDAPPPCTGAMPDVDLSAGLSAVEQQLDEMRPGAIRIRFHGHLVGELPAVAGAEPLRGVHLRPLLLECFADGLVRASARAGVLPAVFRQAAGVDLDTVDCPPQVGGIRVSRPHEGRGLSH